MSNFRSLSVTEHGLYELFYFPRSLLASWNVISLLLPPPLICGSNTAGNPSHTAGKVINQPTPSAHARLHAHANIYMHLKADGRLHRYIKRARGWKREIHSLSHVLVRIQHERVAMKDTGHEEAWLDIWVQSWTALDFRFWSCVYLCSAWVKAFVWTQSLKDHCALALDRRLPQYGSFSLCCLTHLITIRDSQWRKKAVLTLMPLGLQILA